MGNIQLRNLSIVALILALISGQNVGKDVGHKICYQTHVSSICVDLQQVYSTKNVTALPGVTLADHRMNVYVQVHNVTHLDLSKNSISALKFHDTGAIELQVDSLCPETKLSKTSLKKITDKKSDSRYEKVKCAFQAKFPGNLNTSKSLNETDKIHSLILKDNTFKYLNDTFAMLSNLQYLDLSNNLIEDLSNEVFIKNTKLLTLILNHNRIRNLHKKTFQSMKNLQRLDLSNNLIATLNVDIFEYLNNLLVLQINNNSNFSSNSNSLSLIFSTGQKFEKLELIGTLLSKVPTVLTRSIRELDLTDNILVSIQCGEMDSYPLLQRLILRNNKLSIIEEDSLGRLEYLTELDIYKNQLRKIPLSLPLGLLRLDVSFNQLEGINRTDFSGLVHLKTLKLSDNRISYLEEFVFSQLDKLEFLDLANNPIKTLTSAIVTGPQNLINLQLSNLTQLDCSDSNCGEAFPFTELARLEVLNLASTPLLSQQLTHDQSVLRTLSHLKRLSLADANLTSLNSELVNHLRRLQELELQGNPLDCSGSALWLKKWLLSLNSTGTELGSKMQHDKACFSDESDFTIVKITSSEITSTSDSSSIDKTNLPVSKCATPSNLSGTSVFDLPDVEPVVEKPTLQKTDFLPPILSLSNQTKDNNYDDVYYQNDSPESSLVTAKLKNESTSTERPVTKNVTDPKNIPEHVLDRNLVQNKDTSNSKTTPEEQDRNKTVRREMKNILNKTHIENLKSKQLNVSVSSDSIKKVEENVSTVEGDVETKSTQGLKRTSSPVSQNQQNQQKVGDSNTSADSTLKEEKFNVSNKNSSRFKNSSDIVEDLKSLNNTNSYSSFLKNQELTLKAIGLIDITTKETSESKSSNLQSFNVSQTTDTLDKAGVLKPLKKTDNQLSLSQNQEKGNSKKADLMRGQPSSSQSQQIVTKQNSSKTTTGTVDNLRVTTTDNPPSLSQNHKTPKSKASKNTLRRDENLKNSSTTNNAHPQFFTTTPSLIKKPEMVTERGDTRQVSEMTDKFLTQLTKSDESSSTERHQIKLSSEASRPLFKRTTMRTPTDSDLKNTGVKNTSLSVKSPSSNLTESQTKSEHKLKGVVTDKDRPWKGNHGNGKAASVGKSELTSNQHSLHENVKITDKSFHTGEIQFQNMTTNHSETHLNEMKPNSSQKHVNSENGDKHLKKLNKNIAHLESISSKEDLDKIIDKNVYIGETHSGVTHLNTAHAEKPFLKLNSASPTNHIKSENLSEKHLKNLNRNNFNLESINNNKEDLDKSSGHPGMLIFLLVLSILLFTLSLMLISHWTWCKQLNTMYELGDQQILEESDYEINSLTNFKDHEHW